MKNTQQTNQQGDYSANHRDHQGHANEGNGQQSSQKREFQISQATKERAEALKAYIESNNSRLWL